MLKPRSWNRVGLPMLVQGEQFASFVFAGCIIIVLSPKEPNQIAVGLIAFGSSRIVRSQNLCGPEWEALDAVPHKIAWLERGFRGLVGTCSLGISFFGHSRQLIKYGFGKRRLFPWSWSVWSKGTRTVAKEKEKEMVA